MMATPTAIAEKALDRVSQPKTGPIPGEVKAKLTRGKSDLDTVRAHRKRAAEFANGNHYAELGKAGMSVTQRDTVANEYGGEKPNHKVRRSHDLLGPLLKRKISAATQRVPGYEVNPSTSDPEDYSASRLSENILTAGYETWRIKQAFKKLVWIALVEDEGFIMPVWDSSIGPFIAPDAADPEHVVGMGEIGLRVFGGRMVIWEPGVDFEDSRWCAVEQARPVEVVEHEADFIVGREKLQPDAKSGTSKGKMVTVTEYFERPCKDYPRGRRMTFANGREIFAMDDFPVQDDRGNVIDEQPMQRLSYQMDGSSHRDRGLVRSLIDPIKAYDLYTNKFAEWIQLIIVPRLLAPEGSMTTPRDDTPGGIDEYDPSDTLGLKPEWDRPPDPPQSVFTAQDRSRSEIAQISFDDQVPEGAEVTGKGLQSLYARNELAWQDFIFDLAEVHSKVARGILVLVQRFYTDDRLEKFRGRMGWESFEEFRGADIRGQTDVSVKPGSLEPRTRAMLEQRILSITERFPNAFPPETVIAALNSATPEKLVEGYEEDVAHANRIISQIRSGQFLKQSPRPILPGEEAAPRLNPATGQPLLGPDGQPIMLTEVPGWMPRPFDTIPVQRTVFENWMKTEDWERLDDGKKQASMVYYKALLDFEAKKAQRAAEMQNAQAEALGMENAAKPQQKLPPSRPALPGGMGEGPAGP